MTNDLLTSYDWSAVPEETRRDGQFSPFPRDHLDSSVAHLAELVTS
jgi:hypothetical protein